jgi:hypothetical protein
MNELIYYFNDENQALLLSFVFFLRKRLIKIKTGKKTNYE